MDWFARLHGFAKTRLQTAIAPAVAIQLPAADAPSTAGAEKSPESSPSAPTTMEALDAIWGRSGTRRSPVAGFARVMAEIVVRVLIDHIAALF
ncbi:MAG: hypothetical protein Q7U20_07855 [Caulobacter sp.]|nr:hypothetical protein [Caulobacter sp.]